MMSGKDRDTANPTLGVSSLVDDGDQGAQGNMSSSQQDSDEDGGDDNHRIGAESRVATDGDVNTSTSDEDKALEAVEQLTIADADSALIEHAQEHDGESQPFENEEVEIGTDDDGGSSHTIGGASGNGLTTDTLDGDDLNEDEQAVEDRGARLSEASSQSYTINHAKQGIELSDTESISRRMEKWRQEDPHSAKWQRHKRHFFILSNAGKPIFARYGDEETLAPFMGVLSAVVSFVRDDDETIRKVVAGEHQIVFLLRGPLYFVGVSRMGESEETLRRQLIVVYHQIVMFLTKKAIEKTFERKSGFDLRYLLGASGEQVLMSLIIHMQGGEDFLAGMSFMLQAPTCLKLPPPVRSEVGKAMQSLKQPGVLYGLIFNNFRLVHAIRQKKTELHAEDLLLIANFVQSSATFKASEAWTPICLPKYQPDSLLFAYVSFLRPSLCLVVVSTKADAFPGLTQAKETLSQSLATAGVLDQIERAAKFPDFFISQLRIQDLLHFSFYSSTYGQFCTAGCEVPYSDKRAKQHLYLQYERLHSMVHGMPRPPRLLMRVTDSEASVSWISPGEFELYAVFTPLVTKANIVSACNRIMRAVKRDEGAVFLNPLTV